MITMFKQFLLLSFKLIYFLKIIPGQRPGKHNLCLASSWYLYGGGERDRTDDLMLAKHALSQLSYTPDSWWAREDLNLRPHAYQACALTN